MKNVVLWYHTGFISPHWDSPEQDDDRVKRMVRWAQKIGFFTKQILCGVSFYSPCIHPATDPTSGVLTPLSRRTLGTVLYGVTFQNWKSNKCFPDIRAEGWHMMGIIPGRGEGCYFEKICVGKHISRRHSALLQSKLMQWKKWNCAFDSKNDWLIWIYSVGFVVFDLEPNGEQSHPLVRQKLIPFFYRTDCLRHGNRKYHVKINKKSVWAQIFPTIYKFDRKNICV